MYVVDSCDRERMEEARQHLDRFINESELSDCVLLVLANKQVIKLLSP